MAEVRRRRATATIAPVSRRRDRVRPAEEEEEEEEDVDATRPRALARTKARVVETVEDDYEDEDDEEEPAPRRSKARRAAPVEDDEDEDEDEDEVDDEDEEEPAPKRRAGKLPPGIRTGFAGVEEIRKSGGDAGSRLTIDKVPVLVKVLEREPFVTYRQHWIEQGANQANRPYTCIGTDCPLCGIGNRASQVTVWNVLQLSAQEGPEVKQLSLGIRAERAFEAAATRKGSDTPRFDRDFWAINKSGTGQQSQTNFRLVKLRDVEEDWPEVLENFELEELDDIIAEAKLFGPEVVQVSTRKQLAEVAKYLGDDED